MRETEVQPIQYVVLVCTSFLIVQLMKKSLQKHKNYLLNMICVIHMWSGDLATCGTDSTPMPQSLVNVKLNMASTLIKANSDNL